MPQYDYKCQACNFVFYTIHAVAEHRPQHVCPMCTGIAQQIFISAPLTQIQGLPKNRFNKREVRYE
jgi:putative FmdB family regulatory protein